MFSEPQTITVNAVPFALARVSMGDHSGSFSSADGLTTLQISHDLRKRNRRVVRFVQSKISADPFVADVNRKVNIACTLTIDSDPNGYSSTDVENVAQGLVNFLDTAGILTKVAGGES